MHGATFAFLSTKNLINNVLVIKKLAPKSKIIAMVKANAYAHGYRQVALRLADYVDMFGVARLNEAMILREVGLDNSILLAEGVINSEELIIAAKKKFSVVFHHYSQIKYLEALNYLVRPLEIEAWLKIDTGMGRLGFNDLNEALTAYDSLIKNSKIIKPISIMSHFAFSENINHSLNYKQIEKFEQFIDYVPNYVNRSLCNSAAIFNFPEQHFEFVRPGLALYGVSPFADKTAEELGLKPVMTLHAKLISIKNLKLGDNVGYGCLFSCPENMPVGIISVGYADGYSRTTLTGAPILINGIKCEIIGRVSMDMLAVDLRKYPHAQIGDLVTLWGNNLPIEEVACYTNNSPYDLLTGVQNRVKFIWVD